MSKLVGMSITTNHVTIEKLLVLTMFVVSGIQKITNPCRDAKRMRKSVGIGSKELMRMIGAFELMTALVAIFMPNSSVVGKRSLMALALFTIAATLMFYTHPFKQNQFLSNVTTFGALVLLHRQ